MDFEKIATGAAAGAVFDKYALGLTFPFATILGALAPLVKVEAKATYTFEPAKENLKLSYLSSASALKIIDRK